MKETTKELIVFIFASTIVVYWLAAGSSVIQCHAACGPDESLLSCQIDSLLSPGVPSVAVCIDTHQPDVKMRAVKMSK